MTGPPRLIGDIGGTHVRLALANSDGTILARATVEGDDFPSLSAAILAGIAQMSAEPRPRNAVLAVAGPVTGPSFTLTNRPEWSVAIEQLRHDLSLNRLTLINDFAALALAIPALREADSVPLGPPDLVAEPGAPIGVLGPGTGLGVAGLVRCAEGWAPIAGEGGHALIAAADDREAEILTAVRRFGGRTSGDRILSGPGLSLIHAALAGTSPEDAPDAATIADDESSLARETLAQFAKWLGAFAGDLALTLGARGGIYIGGGVVPNLGEAFPVDRFRAGFEVKGRLSDYVRSVPTRLIVRKDAPMLGVLQAFGRTGTGIVTSAGPNQ